MIKIIKWLGLLFFIVLLLGLFNLSKIQRLLRVNSLFEEANILENFQDMEEYFPTTNIPASSRPLILPERLDFRFPETFTVGGVVKNTQTFLDYTRTEGLLVIHKDTIVYENYFLGLEPSEKHISWSMSKSFIGTLMGVVIEQGLIGINDKVIRHLPEFIGTGYEEVTVLDLLQMRSGIAFNEDYGDYNSDINRFGRAFALGTSYKEFAKSLKNELPPGSNCHYVSIDTQMLGFLISKVTGQSLTEVLQKYMWEPMGMEHAGGWIKDNTDFEMALGGMTATLRDFAKLGLLYIHQGSLNGNKVVSPKWVKDATSRHGEVSGRPSKAGVGYGYQWWIPRNDTGDFYAIGIYEQFVYVNPEKELVIAKLSADHNFTRHEENVEAQHLALFQQIAAGL